MPIILTDNDVLLGRGRALMVHPGNGRMRSLAVARKRAFQAAKKRTAKRAIAHAIVDEIHRMGGRFLVEDPARANDRPSPYDKAWVEVEHDKAVAKVMHKLREKDKDHKDQGSKGGVDAKESRESHGGGSIAPSAANAGSSVDEDAGASLLGTGSSSAVPSDDDIEDSIHSMLNELDAHHDRMHSTGKNVGGSLAPGTGSSAVSVDHGAEDSIHSMLHELDAHHDMMQSTGKNVGGTIAPSTAIAGSSMDEAGASLGAGSSAFPPDDVAEDSIHNMLSDLDHGPVVGSASGKSWHAEADPRTMDGRAEGHAAAAHATADEERSESIGVGDWVRLAQDVENAPGVDELALGGEGRAGASTIAHWTMDARAEGHANAAHATADGKSEEEEHTTESIGVGDWVRLAHDVENAPGIDELLLGGEGHAGTSVDGAKGAATIAHRPRGKQEEKKDPAGHNGEQRREPNDNGRRKGGRWDPVVGDHARDSKAVAQDSIWSEAFVPVDEAAEDPKGGSGGVEDPLDVDDELGLLLRDAGIDPGEDEQLLELPLREWIKRSRATLDSEAWGHVSREYVLLALRIALHLTECLIEADGDEQHGGNPIPLVNITAAKVWVRIRGSQAIEGLATNDVQCAWIMNSLGDNSDTGGPMPRLFALGTVLCELISGGEILEHWPSFDAPQNVDSIDLSDEAPEYRPQKKKSQMQPGWADDKFASCILRLESQSVPWSVCTLVDNLLQCSNGGFALDNAYNSLQDLQSDLQLMINDPSRFLDNIQTNPMPSLSICDKMYGRVDEMTEFERSYGQYVIGGCTGVLISGGAGVGKSKLATHMIQRLANQSNGYILVAKFDQSKYIYPLSTVGAVFSSLCDQFAQDSTPSQLKSVEEALERALGNQASLLAGIVPSLSKLLPSLSGGKASSSLIDAALSMRFQFSELLRVISSHSRPISFVWDDTQWADSASLLVIGDLLSNVECGHQLAFFAICHRDGAASQSGQFKMWLSSIGMLSLNKIELGPVPFEGVNELVSDALHLSPRITRPLSSVLERKTRGNPFFLWQLMGSLVRQNLIYVNFHPPRWAWQLDKIADLEISDDVVVLLIEDVRKLSPDLQLGLQVAACIGSSVTNTVLGILSEDLGVDLLDALKKISRKGYMESDGTTFNFVHDKVQQAAGELRTEEKKRHLHMQLGLSLCKHVMSCSANNDEIFFISVNQMNRGGPDAVYDPQQKSIVADLNLQAGRRSVDVSDHHSALQLFENGISFLGDNRWVNHYGLSVELFGAASESACMLNDIEAFKLRSEELLSHAKCIDDKLTCLFTAAKALRHADRLAEPIGMTMKILAQLSEEPPRVLGDETLNRDILTMNNTLQSMTDDSILNMREASDQKVVTLLKIYSVLAEIAHFAKPAILGAVFLRMVDLTIENGLTTIAPYAFAVYGEMLVSIDNLVDGCRLGRLALKLVEKEKFSTRKSSVICTVQHAILWAFEPLQSIADAHLVGHKSGQQSGDFLFSSLNLNLSICTGYLAGRQLDSVQEDLRKFVRKLQSSKAPAYIMGAALFHTQTRILAEGLHILDSPSVDNIPTEKEVVAIPGFMNNKSAKICMKILKLERAILFRQLDDVSLDTANVWDEICDEKHILRPNLCVGVFLEGVVLFNLARQRECERSKWIERGDVVLAKMKSWSEHSAWNWENKSFLLEAGKMHALGDYDRAALLYESAIRSARRHRFIHEEAMSSDLAGVFFYERGANEKALSLLIHSVRCYEAWGASAVAKLVEGYIASKYGPVTWQQLAPTDDALDAIFLSSEGSATKKRTAES